MTRLIVLFVALLAASSVWAQTTAFVNVNVVPMSSETVIKQQTVVVSGGVITALGPVDEVPIPKGAKVIDGTDRFLMPGLAEMHAHVPAATSDELDRNFSLYVANGVTTIRGMLGQPSHIGLREDLNNGSVFGPRLVTSGPSFNGRSVAGAIQARQMVRDQHRAGYDFVKIHPGLTAEEFEALAETANELGMPFAGHVPVAVGVARALQVGMATIDHLDGYFAALLPVGSDGFGGYGGFFDVMLAAELDPERIPEIARATAAAGTWNVPTEVLVEVRINTTPTAELRSQPGMRYMPKTTVERWVASKEALFAERDFNPEVAALAIELRHRLLLELHKAGAGLLLGSDSPQVFSVPGFSLHQELDALVAAGLTPYEALRTGTVAVAEFLNSNAGTVAVDRDADLVLVNANPLENVRHAHRIHGVMLRGLWYSVETLAERLARYADHEN
ncbi:MAG: amidohydrolase family protein [Gammaproteobacteria bacterium]|nr:amidohydrolase family protein [Gammaproteobacteria bacterium]